MATLGHYHIATTPNIPEDEKFDIIDTERLADLVRLIRTLPKF